MPKYADNIRKSVYFSQGKNQLIETIGGLEPLPFFPKMTLMELNLSIVLYLSKRV